MKFILFIVGWLVLVISEVLRVYYIMPFPGSQEADTIEWAYFLHQNIYLFRLVGVAMISWPAFHFARSENVWVKWPTIVSLSFWLLVVYLFNFRFLAEKMFYQPEHKVLASMADNKVPAKQLIVGVTINGVSKAYPIEIIGYHHQVRDTVGGEPIMVTYCTVCRTGRVYKPEVNGTPEQFRLVGMDHYNAMFEDATTGSWWRQVSGEAIIGPLKGTLLAEIPSNQMTLGAWGQLHPQTQVMQPDSAFIAAYEGLKGYDEGTMKGRLEGKDSVSWREKSWIVGLQIGTEARAYDWIELTNYRVANDVVAGTPIAVWLEPDSVNFHAFERATERGVMSFVLSDSLHQPQDEQTRSVWNWQGQCITGPLAGTQLKSVNAYQEYWHSWQTFRPTTTTFRIQ